MNISESTYHLVDQYLQGELSGKALADFENQLANDAELKAALEQQQLVNEVVTQASNHELRLKIQSGIADFDNRNKSNKHLKYGLGALALLIGSSLFIALQNEDLPTQQKNISTGETQTSHSPSSVENNHTENFSLNEGISTTPIHRSASNNTSTTEIKSVTPDEVQASTTDDVLPIDNPEKQPINTPTIAPEVTAQKPTIVQIDCKTVKMTAKPLVKPACIGEANGSITLKESGIRGGKAPYTIHYKGNTSNEFRSLFAGYYNFKISDASGCITDVEVELTETACFKTSHTLNMMMDQPILLLENADTEVNLSIYDKAGTLIYKKTTDAPLWWDGKNESGNAVPTGLYLFIIEKGNETLKGQITVLN